MHTYIHLSKTQRVQVRLAVIAAMLILSIGTSVGARTATPLTSARPAWPSAPVHLCLHQEEESRRQRMEPQRYCIAADRSLATSQSAGRSAIIRAPQPFIELQHTPVMSGCRLRPMVHDDRRSLKGQVRDFKGVIIIEDWHEELIHDVKHRPSFLNIASPSSPPCGIEP